MKDRQMLVVINVKHMKYLNFAWNISKYIHGNRIYRKTHKQNYEYTRVSTI